MLYFCIFPLLMSLGFLAFVANFLEMESLYLKKSVTCAEGMHVDRFHYSYIFPTLFLMCGFPNTLKSSLLCNL
jgi:hypothetical protein